MKPKANHPWKMEGALRARINRARINIECAACGRMVSVFRGTTGRVYCCEAHREIGESEFKRVERSLKKRLETA